MQRDKEPARKCPQLLYSSNFDIVPIIFYITQALPAKYDCHRMLQFQNDYDKVRQNKVRQNFIVNSIKRISRLQSMVDIGQITFSSCSWLPIEDPHEISRLIALERNLRTFLKVARCKACLHAILFAFISQPFKCSTYF